MGYRLIIDEHHLESEDPILTGRQLLGLAGKRPPEEHLVMVLGPDRQLEDIDLEETTDLRAPGREVFITFRSDRSFNFELDGQRQPWGDETVSETTLMRLSGAASEYRVWQEKRGEEDRLLERGERVPLTPTGVERFYSGRPDTTAGRCALLPNMDQRYLEDHELDAEVVTQGSQKGIVFRDFVLPADRFDHPKSDILLILPGGYPDAPPDMFYCFPWIKLRGATGWPEKADHPQEFAGRRWQRWSRHNSEWRPGIDGIHTMLRRIDAALRGGA